MQNNPSNTATVLGGWVQGNGALTAGPARVILTEVSGGSASQLRGYIEVAGSRAEVVVANPAGISCDGCGFINVNRATLAAATPLLAEGGQGPLTGWRSRPGVLQITGAGLDGGGLDYAALIAHAVRVDAQLRVTGQLQVVAGAQEVAWGAQGAVAAVKPFADASGRPAVAIDVSRLGGMYAGAIHLVGYGNGVGVRNAGDIGATAGALRISASGWLENLGSLSSAGPLGAEASAGVSNRGAISSEGPLRLSSQGVIDNTGQVLSRVDLSLEGAQGVEQSGDLRAGGDLAIVSNSRIRQAGRVAAGGDLRLDAGAQGSVEADAASLNLAGVLSDGRLSSQGRILVSGDAVALGGRWQAGAALVVDARSTWLGGAVLRASQISLTSREGDLDLTGADLLAGNTLTFSVRNTLVTAGARVEAPRIFIAAGGIDNRGGLLRQTGPGLLQLSLGGALLNQGGILSADQGDLALVAGSVSNQGGLIAAGGDIRLQTQALNNADGQVDAGGSLQARLLGDHTPDGRWLAGQGIALDVQGRLVLGSARLEAPRLAFKADSLLNLGETRATELRVTTGALENRGELTGDTLRLQADSLDNPGLVDGTDVRIDTRRLDNHGTGRIYGDRLAIAADALTNRAEGGQAAVIAARDSLNLGVGRLDNSAHSLILSAGDLALGGALDAQGQAMGRAALVTNSSATIEALGALRLSADLVQNVDPSFRVEQVTLPPEQVTEYQPAAGGPRYREGTPGLWVFNAESDHLRTPDGQTWEHWYAYTVTRTVRLTRIAVSDPARILSGGDMRIDAGRVRNEQGQIVAGRRLQLSGALENIGVTGERWTTDSGSVTEFWRERQRGWDRTGSRVTDYQPPPTRRTFDLGASEVQGNRAAPSGATAPPPPPPPPASPPSTVGQGPASSGANPPASGTGANTNTNTNTNTNAGALPDALPLLRLPTSSLYRVLPDPSSHYLVETDPRFTDGRRWLGSDYLLGQLGLQPAAVVRRLGDGFYEQRLLVEQITRITGQRRIAGYSDDHTQFQALMDSGATAARRLSLVPGVALSPEQVAQLSSDIVWLVAREVQLPDGSTTTVLVPQVYLQPRPGDLSPTGSLIAANQAELQVTGDLRNGGTIAGRQVLTISAENLVNQGLIGGGQVALQAQQDIANIGGTVRATTALTLGAGRDLKVTSTTSEQANAQGRQVQVDRVAGLYVSDPAGTLVARAGRDVQITAAVVRSEGSAQVVAGRDLVVDTLQTHSSQDLRWDAQNARREATSAEVGSQLSARGAVTLEAGQDLRVRAASVRSDEGAATLSAGRDVRLEAGEARQQLDLSHQHTSRDTLSSETVRKTLQLDETSAQVAQVEGRSVRVEAGRDLRATGAQIVGDGAVSLRAAGDITLESARDRSERQSVDESRRTGVFGSGGTGFTIGSRRSTTEEVVRSDSAVKGSVGSLQGDIDIRAGGRVRAEGTDLLAPQGSIQVEGKQVEIIAAQSHSEVQSTTRTRQTGVTVSVSNPVVSAVQTAEQMDRAAGDTGSARVQALAVAATALAVRDAAQAVARNPGAAGGVTFSASLGTSRSESTHSASSEEAVTSRVIAGKDLRVRATGAAGAAGATGTAGVTDADGTVLLRGVQARAGGRVEIDAARDLRIEAARSTVRQRDTEHSSSASVGVSVGTGSPGGAPPQVGVTVAVSGSRGRADGEETRWTLSHIDAGQQVQLRSGQDTVLSGAVVSAPKVVADVGGELLVESLQDTSRYDSNRAQASANVTFGPGPSAGVGLGGSRVDSHFASVTEQAGIRAGDGGFHVRAQGGTELRGGAITSTDAAVAAGQNRLDTPKIRLSDIDNRAAYRAEAASVNIGASYSADGQTRPAGTSAGFGSDSGQAASVTRAGVSGIAGNTTARTGDAQTGISPLFDAGRVQREVDAQVAITQRIGEQVPRLVADIADGRAQALRTEAQTESDPTRQRALLEQAARWEEGGAARVASHVLVGAVTGGVAGAAGAGAVAAAAPALDALQGHVTAALSDAGTSEGIARGTGQVVANVAALVLGGVAGGGSAAGAALALNVDANNRQLHPTEIRWIKDNARRFAKQMGISEAEAERRLGMQAYRAVQVGVSGEWDASAAAFLRDGGRQLLPADPATAALGPGYFFQATAEQRANPLMYLNDVTSNPIARRFYTDNQLQIPSGSQLSDGSARDGSARAMVGRWTTSAFITAAGLVLSPTLAGAPVEIAEFLRSPVVYCAIRPAACTAVVDAVAATAAGVPITGAPMLTLPRVTGAAAEVVTHPQTAEEVATVVRVRSPAAVVPQAQIVALDATSRRTAEVQEAVFANLPRGIDRNGATHILWGDRPRSGGHLWPGNPGKTPFPPDWSEGRIIATVGEIFTNPKTPWQPPDRTGRLVAEVFRQGVEVRVVYDPKTQRVVSAYPINLPRNPK
ncbi:MAG: hemagglutinin repeat-containing protein [Ramlibacter sp.]|nr:hemagglutinin repeat-containing protein [Ramlibacter sp.]MDH4375659.1 hemagglutinin repeat-containing protein [Ramlibacter sp.]